MLGTIVEAASPAEARARVPVASFADCDVLSLGFCDGGVRPIIERFPPNIRLPRLENSNCSKRSSAKRLSLGISVVRGMKAVSCWIEEEMEPRDPSESEGLVGRGGGIPAVGDLGDFGPFSEPHVWRIEDAVEGDTGGFIVSETKMFFFLRRLGAPDDEERLRLFPNILDSVFMSVGLVLVDMVSGGNVISV
jgi:hypothetical protein